MIKFYSKLLISLFLLTGFVQVFAQQSNQSLVPYWVEQDSLFQHLSKTNIDALYDRVHQWADLHHFNTQTETLSYEYLMQAWHELYLSTYNRSQIIASKDVRKKASINWSQGKGITVGYIDYEFHNIAPYAEDSGFIVKNPQDSLYYDGTTPQNAYQVNRRSLPIIASDEIEVGTQKFYFDPTVKLVSSKFANQSVTITIRSGGLSITLTPGQTKTLNISNGPSGRPSVSLDMSITPGIMHTFPEYLFLVPEMGLINSVTTNECHSTKDLDLWSGPTLTFQGYDESVPTQGKGQYTVYYKMNSTAPGDCIDNKITKPVIILDGFDPQNDNQRDTDDLWELLSYGSTGHFGDDMRTQGYDVVVLNFPVYTDSLKGIYDRDGGADYIERNAMVLIALINKVKQELATNGSSEEIVIIGPSMGGQITRYALKYMENNGMDHKTRLFIAFDSPNHGANIPIGIQSAIFYSGYYKDMEDAKNKYDTRLATPAAKQMLIHQLGIQKYTMPFPPYHEYFLITYSEPFNNTWQSNINLMGYPDNLRKVALVNGNNSGQYKTGGSMMMMYSANDVSGILGDLAEMKIYHLSNSGSFTSFYYEEKFKSPVTLTYNNTKPYGNIDAAPGGTYNGLEQLKEGMDTILGNFLAKKLIWGLIDVVGNGTIDYYSGDRQCFMPIASTLGFKNPYFNWATLDVNNRNLVCENLIEFDNYFTEVDEFYNSAEQNANHVRINERSARWAMEEIKYGKEGCPNICSAEIEQVGGDSYLCPGVNYTFKLDVNVPTGATTTWEVSTGLTIVSSNNNQVVIKYTTGGATPYHRFVKATIIPKIGGVQCSASKIIFKDGLQYGEVFKYENMIHPTDTNRFITKVVPDLPGSQYSWKPDDASSWGPILSGNQRDYLRIPHVGPTKYYYTRVYIPGCSSIVPVEELTGEYSRHGFEYSGGGEVSMEVERPNESREPFKLVPNPTEHNWEVIVPEEFVNNDLMIHIYSMDGRKVGSLQSRQANVVHIPAGHLLSGNYIIEIITGKEKAILRGLKQ